LESRGNDSIHHSDDDGSSYNVPPAGSGPPRTSAGRSRRADACAVAGPSACATGTFTQLRHHLDVHWTTITEDLPMLLAALSPPEEV